MFLKHKTWKFIRDKFTAAEIESINDAITGEVICPPGAEIDLDILPTSTALKLKTLVGTKQV